MTISERQYVQDIIESQGFDYAFAEYDRPFEENVKDPQFHVLCKAYVAAQKALADYIDSDL